MSPSIDAAFAGNSRTALPRSLKISGSVDDWATWTGLAFPDSGNYVFPEGLAPVRIDRDGGTGLYWEPNVWMVHPDLVPGEQQA
jgi:hypothetical protein